MILTTNWDIYEPIAKHAAGKVPGVAHGFPKEAA
jgi:hypothetical protein